MGDDRLPKTALLRVFVGGARYSGGQEFDWERRLPEGLKAFGVINGKKGRESNAKSAEEWYDGVVEGAKWFIDDWYERQRKTPKETSTG